MSFCRFTGTQARRQKGLQGKLDLSENRRKAMIFIISNYRYKRTCLERPVKKVLEEFTRAIDFNHVVDYQRLHGRYQKS